MDGAVCFYSSQLIDNGRRLTLHRFQPTMNEKRFACQHVFFAVLRDIKRRKGRILPTAWASNRWSETNPRDSALGVRKLMHRRNDARLGWLLGCLFCLWFRLHGILLEQRCVLSLGSVLVSWAVCCCCGGASGKVSPVRTALIPIVRWPSVLSKAKRSSRCFCCV